MPRTCHLHDYQPSRSFLAQVPFCVLAFIAVYFILDLPPVDDTNWLSKIRKVDFLGALALVLAVLALLLGLDTGANLGWSHTLTIASLSISPIIFAAFILIEVKVATYPFAPGHVIFDGSLFACYLVNFFEMGAYTAILFFMPLFFQAVLGASATISGAYLVPAMVAVMVASIGGGLIIKRTERFYWITVLSLGLALLAIIPLTASVWFRSAAGESIGLFLCVTGAASGVTTNLVALIANAASEDMALAIACSYLFRSLGCSIAVSLSSASLQQVLRMQLAARFPDGDEARRIEEQVRLSLDYIKKLSPWQAEQVRTSYQMATFGGYGPALIFLAAGFLSSFWIKEKTLKR